MVGMKHHTFCYSSFTKTNQPTKKLICTKIKIYIYIDTYRVAHIKQARRLVDQRGRRSRTLYRKLNKCKCKALTGYRRC